MDTPIKDAEAGPTFPSLRSSDSSLAHVEAFELISNERIPTLPLARGVPITQ